MIILRLTNDEALKMINTLRNGTSPIHHADAWIVGREQELENYRKSLNLLAKGTGNVKLVTGDYGMGKSLLINAYKQIALNEDYVIASFQVNNGFRLNKLEDLYYAIMHNLFLKHKPDHKVSFEDIFDIWVENLQNAPHADRKRFEVNTVCQALSKYNMNFARAFLIFMRGRIQRNQEMTHVASAWLTGERNIPYELKHKYDLVGTVDKTNTLDFLKAFTKLITLLDYKGLIVFIDEIDLVINDRSDLRQTAYNNLKHLVDLSTSGEMNQILFMFSGASDIVTHPEKGLITNTALAQRLNLTHTNNLDGSVIRLNPIDTKDVLTLTQNILRLYRQNKTLPNTLDYKAVYDAVTTKLGETMGVTRTYVTTLIGYLDTLSH